MGKWGQKSETSKQTPTRKTEAAVDRRQKNMMLIKAVSVRHCAETTAPRNCCPNCYAADRVTKTVSVAPPLGTGQGDDDDELMLNVLRCHLTY